MRADDRAKLAALLRERLPDATVIEPESASAAIVCRLGGLGWVSADAITRRWQWGWTEDVYPHTKGAVGPYTGRGWIEKMAHDIAAAVGEVTP